jgi:hypothetical protein
MMQRRDVEEVEAAVLVDEVGLLVGLLVMFVVWRGLKITPFALRRNGSREIKARVGHNRNCHQKCKTGIDIPSQGPELPRR